MSDGTAKKRDPKKWAEAKARARKKMGGHSARAMQLAVKYYKDAGGTYEGKKSKDNKLSKWSKEDWGTREEYEKEKKEMNITQEDRQFAAKVYDDLNNGRISMRQVYEAVKAGQVSEGATALAC